jgi:hypothetical protein
VLRNNSSVNIEKIQIKEEKKRTELDITFDSRDNKQFFGNNDKIPFSGHISPLTLKMDKIDQAIQFDASNNS